MNDGQRAGLVRLFQTGADAAAVALSRWLGRPASIAVRDVELLPLEAAADLLGAGEDPVCGAGMPIGGALSGILLLVADDAAGLALADLLVGRSIGTGRTWGEVEESATLETANIVGCAYLNAIASALPVGETEDAGSIIPSPPTFVREYAPALMEGLLIDQAALSDTVFLTRTEFAIDGAPVRCALVFVPDAPSRARIIGGSIGLASTGEG